MDPVRTAAIARDDTFLGVCHAIGEDFGFNPLYLRIGLAMLLFWNPAMTIGGYAIAGLIVLLSRFLFPNPRPLQSACRAAGEPETLQPASMSADARKGETPIMPIAA